VEPIESTISPTELPKAYQKLMADIDSISKAIEEWYSKDTVLPTFDPHIEQLPEVPKLRDTFNNLSNLTKIVINLAIIGATVYGLREGLPEGGLMAFNQMLEAFRKKDLEEFENAMKQFNASISRFQAMNDAMYRKYLADVEAAKYKDQRSLQRIAEMKNIIQLVISASGLAKDALNLCVKY